MRNIVIIGNGISGITCARHIRKKSDDAITIISAETEHFFSRTALMYVYMGHMKYDNIKPYEDWFWERNRLTLLYDHVEKVNIQQKDLVLKSEKNISYDILIIASGSASNKFGWPGQDLKGVQGLYSYPDLQLMEENTNGIKKAVVVGGGLIGIEMTEMLLSRNIPVTLLVRETNFWDTVLPLEEAQMINRHIREHHVDLRLETELKNIEGDERGHVKSIITKDEKRIPCQFVGLGVGVHPNISFLENSNIETDRGVLVNEYFETNIPQVYAIGDCAQYRKSLPGRKPIEQVWYTGRMHGETLAQTICGQRTAYNPGPWFNSAKFFDIEYQTYGTVTPQQSENEETFYWEHENGKIDFRVVYEKMDHTLIGINSFGFRLRHKLFDKWLQEKRTVEFMMEHLAAANFDPEFFQKHERSIVNSFNEKTGNKIKLKRRSRIKELIRG
ncbi:MAG: NAD(P)/FAD-dependent oxidoreductase [Chitinophagaceae bacterium]|nr:MAG: NAD(P)/FAD-dependent oxidoreductase [Chitinophagaceae bacterium]